MSQPNEESNPSSRLSVIQQLIKMAHLKCDLPDQGLYLELRDVQALLPALREGHRDEQMKNEDLESRVGGFPTRDGWDLPRPPSGDK